MVAMFEHLHLDPQRMWTLYTGRSDMRLAPYGVSGYGRVGFLSVVVSLWQ